MKLKLVSGLILSACLLCAAADKPGLRAALETSYPSLAYVERYRSEYPEDVEGTDLSWLQLDAAPALVTPADVTRLLMGLADQHVALAGPKAGKTETLGVLFRTSTDGAMTVWRVLEPASSPLRANEEILAVNGRPTAHWLAATARLTFGGNDRSRQAEAALNLGLGTPAAHEVAGLDKTVALMVRNSDGAVRTVQLAYKPMSADFGGAVANAVEAPDLPDVMQVGRYRIGTIRIGAFAPQYDRAFKIAADAAPVKADNPDGPMLAGFCAVTRNLVARFDTVARRSDFMVVDLRGNMGGFAREARAFAWALTGRAPVQTYDVVASGVPGRVRLQPEVQDPDCGVAVVRKPLFVLVDAGTRSGGELLATYLWAAGATVLGERTVGAGGGRDSVSPGVPVGDTGYNALISENFYVFDPKGELRPGDMPEGSFVDRVAENRFAPSHERPYTTQAVGVLPDVALTVRGSDLRDGGADLLARGIRTALTARLR